MSDPRPIDTKKVSIEKDIISTIMSSKMTTTLDNPWTALSNNKPGSIIYGTYLDRFIVFQGQYYHTMIFDIQTHQVETLPDRKTTVSYGCQGTILDGVLYSFDYNENLKVVIHRFCPWKMSKWERIGSNLQFYPHCVLSHKGFIYIVDIEADMRIYRYTPEIDTDIDTDTDTDNYKDNTDGSLTEISKLPTNIMDFGAAAIGDKIYIIGGMNKKCHFSSRVHVFDITAQTWSEGPSLPRALEYTSATTVADRWIVVTGGYNYVVDFESMELNRKIYVFDTLLGQQWYESDIISPEYNHQCSTIGHYFVCTGRDEDEVKKNAIYIKRIIPEWNYEYVKHFILMRKLIDEGRAAPIIPTKKQKKDTAVKIYEDQDKVMQNLIMNTSLDMFRNVLSFLL